MGFMKYFRYLCIITSVLVLSMIGSGCTGGVFEYVETVNKPSNEVLSGRYVSHRRSVKVNVINKRLRFEFALPRKQTRVHKRQVEILLKRYDFGEWVKKDRLAWFRYVSLKSTPTCADNRVRFRTELPVHETNQSEVLDVEFVQDKEGLIKILVRGQHRKIPLVSLEIHLQQGTSHKHVTCVNEWRGESALGNIATHLMQLRNGIIDTIRKPVGLDLKAIGTRLSRKYETPPNMKSSPREETTANLGLMNPIS